MAPLLLPTGHPEPLVPVAAPSGSGTLPFADSVTDTVPSRATSPPTDRMRAAEASPTTTPSVAAVQASFDDLGTPLSEVTFVVVDLETTGGSPRDSRITEIGAVKVRGGQVLGEFQTLVNPGEPIPAFISVLTGITDAMVATAPRIGAVLPAFLEFAGDAVLVAHNAPFDIGFLRAAAAQLDLTWPRNTVVDTVQLARQLIGRDETPNHKLSSLAVVFGAEQTPDHRALHDARATMDVLHGLIERVGNLGVHSLEELRSYSSRVTQAQRRKRHLARDLPHAPGVYLFRDAQGRVLYVGTSGDIRRRVSTYFTAAEQRSRMARMVAATAQVTPIVCATAVEAAVREVRLIAEHEPPFNRRSRRPLRRPWVKLTVETFPRLSIVREMRADGAAYVGPFASRQAATDAIDAIHDVLPLRRCTRRLSRSTASAACALAELGRCLAPCRLPALTTALGRPTRAIVEDVLDEPSPEQPDKQPDGPLEQQSQAGSAATDAAPTTSQPEPTVSPTPVAAQPTQKPFPSAVEPSPSAVAPTPPTPTTGEPEPTYQEIVDEVEGLLIGRTRAVFESLTARMRELSDAERYEDAAVARDRLTALARACDRSQRLAALRSVAHLVAARRSAEGGWEVACIRHGRLAGATRTPRAADPMPYIDACVATAEVVTPESAPVALPEETELLVRWLERDGVRLVELSGQWSCPVAGAAIHVPVSAGDDAKHQLRTTVSG